jgi:hypothetical protein
VAHQLLYSSWGEAAEIAVKVELTELLRKAAQPGAKWEHLSLKGR